MITATNGSEYGEYQYISEGFVPCAERPSAEHKLSPDWKQDPMDPAVCWVAKDQAEPDVEKDAQTEARWRDDVENDKLMSLLYDIDARLRVLEGKNAITKQTFWNGLKNFLRNTVFFDF